MPWWRGHLGRVADAQFLGSCFRLKVEPLEANNLSLRVFDQNEPVPDLLANLLTLRLIPLDRQGFSYRIVDDFYLGHISVGR